MVIGPARSSCLPKCGCSEAGADQNFMGIVSSSEAAIISLSSVCF